MPRHDRAYASSGGRSPGVRAVRDFVHPAARACPVLLGPVPDGVEPRARRRGRRPCCRDRLVRHGDDRGGRAARRRRRGPAPPRGGCRRGGVVGHPRRRHPGPLPPARLRERPGGYGRAAARDRGDSGGPPVRPQPARQVRRPCRVHPPRRRRRRRLDLAAPARTRARRPCRAGPALGAEQVPRLPGAARRARHRRSFARCTQFLAQAAGLAARTTGRQGKSGAADGREPQHTRLTVSPGRAWPAASRRPRGASGPGQRRSH